jgi:hypothetical protein
VTEIVAIATQPIQRSANPESSEEEELANPESSDEEELANPDWSSPIRSSSQEKKHKL